MSDELEAAYEEWVGDDDGLQSCSIPATFAAGWHARDEEIAALLARAGAAEGRVREIQRRINEAQCPETIADAIHEGAWDRGRRRGLREAQTIVQEVAGADPPMPTGEASGAEEPPAEWGEDHEQL